jgi:hypothetical protein
MAEAAQIFAAQQPPSSLLYCEKWLIRTPARPRKAVPIEVRRVMWPQDLMIVSVDWNC